MKVFASAELQSVSTDHALLFSIYTAEFMLQIKYLYRRKDVRQQGIMGFSWIVSVWKANKVKGQGNKFMMQSETCNTVEILNTL